jgi:hypothetical protein
MGAVVLCNDAWSKPWWSQSEASPRTCERLIDKHTLRDPSTPHRRMIETHEYNVEEREERAKI